MPSRKRWPIHRPPTRLPGPWKYGPIPVIGVVGGIGSGKSAVAARLGELGAFVIDADRVGHALLTQRPVLEAVVRRFGPEILAPVAEGTDSPREIDRRALGAIVFADRTSRRALEGILHPRMRETFSKAIARTARRGQHKAVVLDAAVLFEAGWDALCDRVFFVDAPRDQRLARLAAQRGWDDETLSARENAQGPLEEKRDRADAVVANKDGLGALASSADLAWTSVFAGPPRVARPSPTSAARAGPPRKSTDRPGNR